MKRTVHGTRVRRKTGAGERLLAGLGVLAVAVMLILPLAGGGADAQSAPAGAADAVPVMARTGSGGAGDVLLPPQLPASYGEDRSVVDALGEFVLKLIFGE